MKKFSFPPAGSTQPRILILGSMPGEASLAAQQYYAHPRNAFWPIMGKLFGALPTMPYSERLEVLAKHDIALWDCLHACLRTGSLDTAITDEEPNDFEHFFASHPTLTHVFFNGTKAEQCFRKYVLPHLHETKIHFTRLPSTSPAHAGMNFANKLEAWQVIRQVLKAPFPNR